VFREDANECNSVFDESSMMRHFMLRAPQHRESHQSFFDWLCLMQHYDLPTRLLDWSESVLVALYFAAQSSTREPKATDVNEQHAKDAESNGAGKLFALNPQKLNEITIANWKSPDELHVHIPESFEVVLRSAIAANDYLDSVFMEPSLLDAAGRSLPGGPRLFDALSRIARTIPTDQFLNDETSVEGIESDAQLGMFSELADLLPRWCEDRTPEDCRAWFRKFLTCISIPVAVYPYRSNGRMVSQSSMFIIAGGKQRSERKTRDSEKSPDSRTGLIPCPESLEAVLQDNEKLFTAEVPDTAKKHLLDELAQLGIHQGNLFPEIDKQSAYIKRLWRLPGIDRGVEPGR
jgi:hypothetical protein